MGPCLYCKKMIYDEWIAERGYHRQCKEQYSTSYQAQIDRDQRHLREHEKRRARKHQKRINQKAGIEK